MIRRLLNRIGGHQREILLGAASTFLLRILGIAIEFALHVAIGRLLGAEGAGVFFLAITVVTISSVFGRLGLDNAVLRFVAARSEVNDWEAVRGVSAQGVGVAVGVTVAIAALLIASVTVWVPWLSEQGVAVRVVGLMLLAAPAMSAMFIYGEMLKGLRKVGWSQFVIAVVPFAVALALLPALEARYELVGVAIAYVAGIYCAVLVGVFAWRRSTPQLRGIGSNFSLRRLLETALPLLMVKSLRLAAGWLATIAIAGLMSDADVGVFNAAMRTSLLLGVFLIAVNSIAAPKFAALYERGDSASLAATARWSTLLLGSLTLPVFIVFLGFPAWVMSLFGPDFVDSGKGVLVVLTAGQIINVLTGPVNYLLMMTGHEKDVRNVTMVSFATCLVTIWPFISAWGLLGAAVSVAASVAIMNLLSAVYVRLRLGFFTLPFLPARQVTEQ